ncbi:NAD(P)-dependent oxidoreductase [Anaerocolumna sedimenticola]|uniref:NAD(P)-dependent oxidoreductase n=1 Tax=Anaerocolumna sedimenticola TaxID=2696063 RepID=UPI002ED33A29
MDRRLKESDVISLHCPLLPSTLGIISNENIAKMKGGVIIINTSREPLVVEKDSWKTN